MLNYIGKIGYNRFVGVLSKLKDFHIKWISFLGSFLINAVLSVGNAFAATPPPQTLRPHSAV